MYFTRSRRFFSLLFAKCYIVQCVQDGKSVPIKIFREGALGNSDARSSRSLTLRAINKLRSTQVFQRDKRGLFAILQTAPIVLNFGFEQSPIDPKIQVNGVLLVYCQRKWRREN